MKKEEFFSKLDLLYQNKEAFFFLCNYELDEFEIFTLKDISANKVYFQFPNGKHLPFEVENIEDNAEIIMHSFPESFEDYQKKFIHLQKEIFYGNSYLGNLTTRTPVHLSTTPTHLFLQGNAKYKVYFPQSFLSFSPESFVLIQGDTVHTFPMKGTVVDNNPDAKMWLLQNEKETAEHYTVVDLLRNDLNIVAENVKVVKFKEIIRIPTQGTPLLGMHSHISGTLKADYKGRPGSALARMLPAGSVTGAPKKKTVEILQAAENLRRNYYCGIAGYFCGNILETCVLIRFLEIENGLITAFSSGGGITADSNAWEEYQEMLSKIYVPLST